MPAVLRIIDANANRAREALRVMEDAARFVLNDAALAEPIKRLRHDLAGVLSSIANLESHRDTPGDVGTSITTPAERSRAGVAQVALAAGKRLSEALRSIEEYGKTLPDRVGVTGFASAIESLRYRGYDIEAKLNLALHAGRARQWKCCLLLTESLCRLDDVDVFDQALDAGIDCIQIREKQLDDGPLCDRLIWMKTRAVAYGVTMIVNDRPHVAAAAGVDGVHLGQTDLPCAKVRALFGQQLLIGVSTSNLAEARAAQAAGADYVGVGPMFPTTTKDKPVLAGPGYLRDYLADENLRDLPHLAIGGITPDNLPQLIAVGVRGIAVSSAVCAADRPSAVIRELTHTISP